VSFKYYCGNLAPDDLHWELGVVRERLFKEPKDSEVAREYQERLAELNAMALSAASGEPPR
jgi:hypothetical protein